MLPRQTNNIFFISIAPLLHTLCDTIAKKLGWLDEKGMHCIDFDTFELTGKRL